MSSNLSEEDYWNAYYERCLDFEFTKSYSVGNLFVSRIGAAIGQRGSGEKSERGDTRDLTKFSKFWEILQKKSLPCLCRYFYRASLRQVIDITNEEIARQFSRLPLSEGSILQYNLPSLVNQTDTKRREALSLLKRLGAFQDPSDITVVLFLADLSDPDVQDYVTNNIQLPEGLRPNMGQEAAIKWLVRNPANGSKKIDLQSLLCYAAENGQVIAVKTIIHHCEEVPDDAESYGMLVRPTLDYRKALEYALSSEKSEVVQFLIDNELVAPTSTVHWPPRLMRGGAMDTQNDDIETTVSQEKAWVIGSLAYAALTGNVAITEYLLGKGLDPNQRENRLRDTPYITPLGIAHGLRNMKCVRRHLESKSLTLGPFNREGETPLHLAAYLMDRPLMESLLERGADINSASRFGKTPFSAYIGTDDPSRLEISFASELIKGWNASVFVADGEGRTPLMYYDCSSREITKLLAPDRKAIYAEDHDKEIPLTLNAHQDNVIRELLPLYVKQLELDIRTAFSSAVKTCCPAGAKFALETARRLGFDLIDRETWEDTVSKSVDSFKWQIILQEDMESVGTKHPVADMRFDIMEILNNYFSRTGIHKIAKACGDRRARGRRETVSLETELGLLQTHYTVSYPDSEKYIKEITAKARDLVELAISVEEEIGVNEPARAPQIWSAILRDYGMEVQLLCFVLISYLFYVVLAVFATHILTVQA